MIKADLIKQTADAFNIKERAALSLVDSTIDCLKDVICRFGRLEVRNFGVFQVKTRKARKGRNPKSLTEYPIPGRRVVTFKMGRTLTKASQKTSVQRQARPLPDVEM
jgi:nucleoid DNA-binding protein